MVKKAIIVTPTSLVSNWEAEIKKWVGERVHLIALCESSREDVVTSIDNFVHPKSTSQVYLCAYSGISTNNVLSGLVKLNYDSYIHRC